MMRKTVLAVVAVAVLNVAGAEAQYGAFPIMLGLHGGVRTSTGDDKPYTATIAGTSRTIDNFAQGTFASESLKDVIMGYTLGFTAETRLTNHLACGLDVDIGLGEQTVIGIGVGLGYNHAVAGNRAWLQIKLNAEYAITTTNIGALNWDRVLVNNITIYNPELSISTSFITIRPELNSFYRLATFSDGLINGILIKVGAGYNIPITSVGRMDFVFSGRDGSGEHKSEYMNIKDGQLELKLDGKPVEKTNVSPMGASINIGICFEIS